ncbi:MAG: WYL domain-containing protein [Acidimicrobiia bacterium]|nr:WYL domain-containing protein [Acidimicrobiia bacterium]
MIIHSKLKPEQVRLERLLRLIAALINAPRFLSIEELQTKVGLAKGQGEAGYPSDLTAARRAFHRDMNELTALGVPVIRGRAKVSEKDTWGYRIRKQDYSLPEMDIASDELAALHRATTAVRFHGISGAEALWKLGGQVGEGTDTELAAVPMYPCLADLFRAITEQRTVSFDYSGQPRSVEPWTLAFDQGHWYLMGFDHTRQDKRTFRVDRMVGQVELGRPNGFKQPADAPRWVSIQPWRLGNQPEITAQLWVDAEQVSLASRRLGQEPEIIKDDGSAVFTVQVNNVNAFRSVVLEFLEQAEILKPLKLRTDFVRWLEKINK